jgi:ethanolamine utilization protein EutA
MANAEEPAKPAHSMTDHAVGKGWKHEHAEDADHDHDEYDADGPIEENPLWMQDNVQLVSVGIDIGSSGTQIIFSKIHLRRLAEDLTSRYYVVSRDTLYLSPVSLTPYSSVTRIDDAALKKIVQDAYDGAGLKPADVDAGAVILTGEALRRENAQGISAMLSEQGGDFVCATAGHHMESMLAAYGSGAAQASLDSGKRVLNIDIGGGTTKLGLVEKGQCKETAAFHVGGRLMVVDENFVLTRLDPAGKHHAKRAGFDWNVGDKVTSEALDKVADKMADTLISALVDRPMAHDVEHLYLTDPIRDFGDLGGMMFSGGVAEYVYGRESRDFGDLGRALGRVLARRIEAGALAWPMLPPGECIRATVLGAAEHTVQLSGQTIFISNHAALLPRRNLPVVRPDIDLVGDIDAAMVADAIRAHRAAFDLAASDPPIALAFRWRGAPEHRRVRALAEGIVAGMADHIARGTPLYLMLEGDAALTLGGVLREELALSSELVVIDGVVLRDFDFVDIGRMRLPSHTVPVTIKSLLFGAAHTR